MKGENVTVWEAAKLAVRACSNRLYVARIICLSSEPAPQTWRDLGGSRPWVYRRLPKVAFNFRVVGRHRLRCLPSACSLWLKISRRESHLQTVGWISRQKISRPAEGEAFLLTLSQNATRHNSRRYRRDHGETRKHSPLLGLTSCTTNKLRLNDSEER